MNRPNIILEARYRLSWAAELLPLFLFLFLVLFLFIFLFIFLFLGILGNHFCLLMPKLCINTETPTARAAEQAQNNSSSCNGGGLTQKSLRESA
jgi:hypothetical protein